MQLTISLFQYKTGQYVECHCVKLSHIMSLVEEDLKDSSPLKDFIKEKFEKLQAPL